MLASKGRLRRTSSKYVRLKSGLEKHPAWRGDISLMEGKDLLYGHSPFTFILSGGFDRYHYFLSFVDTDGKVKHRNVRVLLRDGETLCANGGSGGGWGSNARGEYRSIDNLIPSCLGCSARICCPL